MSRLRVLLLEDDPLDVELILANLEAGGIDCTADRVQTRADFEAALARTTYHVILADFSLPMFDGLSALGIARTVCPLTPFIFVSGAIGEEQAIETLKNGATDYVLKQRLDRLVPSMWRALREAEERAERKRLEEELRRHAEELAEAHRRKDEFLAMLAHELRNPLAPIRNALHIMKLRPTEDASSQQARAVIERQVAHLTQLVDDLLDVARITQGKIALRKEWLDLAQLVQRAVETTRPLIDKRQHVLHVALPAEPVHVLADPVRLEQILINLLTNAAKYTDPGGRIEVHARAEEGVVVVAVRDSGVGISAEMQSRIFDLFMQAEHTLDRSLGGLGIGLTLVRRLVDLHGGQIAVHSAGRGQGSTFTVRLPVGAAEAAAANEPGPDNAGAHGGARGARRVLVVDDNRDGAESLAMMLRLWGHEVSVAYDGLAGLELAKADPPAVIVLDIGLPGLDGYEAARRLRAEPATADALLIALTGYGQEEDRRRARAAGFDHHLVKPVDHGALQAVLAANAEASPP